MTLRKILLKVLRGNSIQWVHFCYVSQDLYEEFFDTVKCEKSEFGKFVSTWAQGDFGRKLSMSSFDDIIALKYIVNRTYAEEYSELYALTPEENPKINGWLRMWVSQHMRVEIAARKENYDG